MEACVKSDSYQVEEWVWNKLESASTSWKGELWGEGGACALTQGLPPLLGSSWKRGAYSHLGGVESEPQQKSVFKDDSGRTKI